MRSLIAKAAAGWALLGGALLLAIALVTTVNAGAFALDRLAGLFGADVSGLPGYEDFVRLVVSAAVLMLFPYCQLRRGHIVVDLIARWLSPGLRRALDLAALALIAILALFLAYWMALGLAETRADGALSRVLGWPEWPFYLPGLASLLLWALVALSQLAEGEPGGRA